MSIERVAEQGKKIHRLEKMVLGQAEQLATQGENIKEKMSSRNESQNKEKTIRRLACFRASKQLATQGENMGRKR